MPSFLDPNDWPEAVVILSKDPFAVAGYKPHLKPMWEGATLVRWTEAQHMRSFPVDEVHEQSAEVFDFQTGSMRYRLLPMTLVRYETYVRPRTAGKPGFRSLAELLEAMRREW